MKIAICGIIKNEEGTISGMIRDVAAFADEIVLVDTGSTDATIAVATQEAKKHAVPLRIFVHKDSGPFHFGRAKNRALANSSADYLMMVDADFRFSVGFKFRIRSFLEEKRPILVRLRIRDELLPHLVTNPICVIKNGYSIQNDISESGRIHAQLQYAENISVDAFQETVWHCQRETHWVYNPARMLSYVQITATTSPKNQSTIRHFLRALRAFLFKFNKLYIHSRLYKDGRIGLRYSLLRSLEVALSECFIGLKPMAGLRHWEHVKAPARKDDCFEY